MELDLQSVSARHPAAPPGSAALRGLSLRLHAGEQVAVIGPSGAGKTTLLQVAAATLPPTQGSVRLDGQAPWALPRRELQRLRGRLFLAPQVPPLPPRQRVVTAVLAGRLPAMSTWASLRSLCYPSDLPAAHAALARFDLADKLFERVDRLSGGERQRVGLARALLSPGSLWLIDEPLSALDPARARGAVSALVDEAQHRGLTLLATLHQVDVALAHFPRIVGLRDGELAFDLPAAEVSPERLTRLYAQHEHELLTGAALPADTPRSRQAGGAAAVLSPTAPARDPAWLGRVFWSGAALVLLWPLVVATEFQPWLLLQPDNLRPALHFVAGFFPPALGGDFLAQVLRDTWRTVAMATAGLTLALLIAVPLTLLSTRALSVSALSGRMATGPFLLRQAVRWGLIVLRSIPELVWALIFVRVVGLGPTSGVLAIALTYSGMLGKVYGEILESGDAHASSTLLRNGAGRLQTFFYALLPQNAAELSSYTVYRWECAIRSSVVLGFVGAGGLGQSLDSATKMFNGAEVATMLAVFVALVALADRVSAGLRKALG